MKKLFLLTTIITSYSFFSGTYVAAQPYYDPDISTIFTNNGCDGCHSDGFPSGGLSLDSYDNLFGDGDCEETYVVAFNANSSFLFDKINNDGSVSCGDPMPQGGDLNATEIADIEEWINEGALENVCSQEIFANSIWNDLLFCEGDFDILDANTYGTNDTYAWSSGQTTQTVTVTEAGVYTVTVTHNTDCVGTVTVGVSTDPAPIPSSQGSFEACEGETMVLDAGEHSPDPTYLWSNGETTQTILVTAISSPIEGINNHAVTITNGFACTGIGFYDFFPITTPIPNLGGTIELCEGEEGLLDAGTYPDVVSYNWSNGGTNFTTSISGGGIYNVTLTYDNTCTASNSIEVTAFPLPQPTIAGNLGVCSEQTTALDAGTYASYNWSSGETTQSIAVSSGIYSVTVTNDNLCIGTASTEVSLLPSPQPTITANATELCGEKNGPVLINATFYFDAGAGFDTYLWQTGETNQTTLLTIGGASSVNNFQVTVTDSNGCKGTDEIEVTYYDLPFIFPTVTNNNCLLNSTIIDTGTGDFFGILYDTYQWSTGETAQSIATTAMGVYTVTITTSDGCSNTKSIEVTANPVSTPIPSNQGLTEICEGQSTILDAGTHLPTPTTYTWSSGQNTQTISASTAGAYTVTVTNGDGCSGVGFYDVQILPAPMPTITGDVELCVGQSGVLEALSSGNVAAYFWSTTSTVQTTSINGSGSYTVTVTYDNECTATASIEVEELPSPNVDISGGGAICEGTTTLLDAGEYASAPNSYQWSNTETTRIIEVGSGIYTVTVTNQEGCTGTASTNVTTNSNPIPTIAGNLGICSGQTTDLDAGTYASYNWSSGETTQSIAVSSGIYTVTVTNENLCTGTAITEVSSLPNPQPTITANATELCGQGTNAPGGQATFNFDAGTGFDTYLWSDGAGETSQTILRIISGDNHVRNFQVTVTDANGCTGTDDIDVTYNASPLPFPTVTYDNCVQNSAIIDMGTSDFFGVPYETYQWSTGTTIQSIATTAAGVYTVTITVSNGCSNTASVELTSNSASPPIPSNQGLTEICEGQSTILDAGTHLPTPTTYAWSSGQNTQTISASTAGVYMVTVTNGNGCSGVGFYDLQILPAPMPTITGDIELCVGQSGVLEALSSGNVAAYFWSTSATAHTTSINGSGSYTVTVTYENECTATASIEVEELPSPNVDISGGGTICEGTITLLDAGEYASAPNSYQWSNTETTQVIEVGSGVYTVTVTNQEGCTGTASTSVTTNPNPMPTIAGDLDICSGETSTLDAGAYAAYTWSTTETTQSIVVSSGTYTVTVTDDNLCTGTTSVEVSENALPQPTITGDLEVCYNSTGTLDAGAGYASYYWEGGLSTTQTIEVIQVSANVAIEYFVTVTDQKGCTGAADVRVITYPIPFATHGIVVNQSLCSGSTAHLDAGIGDLQNGTYQSYQWTTGASTQTIEVNTADVYTVTVTNEYDCTGTASINLTTSPNPMPTITGDLETCSGQTTDLDAGTYTSYNWSNGETTQSIAVSSGTYTVTVTNDNLCIGTTSVEVSLLPDLQPTITADALELCGKGIQSAGGIATFNFDAGAGFDTYLWSTGETNQTISRGISGDDSVVNFQVSVTDANGCTGTDDIDVTFNANPIPIPTVTYDNCVQNSTSIDIGTGDFFGEPYETYQWSTGATIQSIAATTIGVYTVTITVSNGCSNTASAEVTANSASTPIPSNQGLTEICEGQSTILDAGVHTPTPTTYSWSSGQNTQTISASTAGAYTVTVTNGDGCSGIGFYDVQILPAPMPTITGDVELCVGQSGILEALSSGNVTAYFWSTNSMDQTTAISGSGSYTVTVTYDNECTATASIEVEGLPSPNVDISGGGAICEGETTLLDAGEYVSAPNSYQWSSTETTQIIEVGSGVYTVTVTNQEGCTGTASTSVTTSPNSMPTIAGDLDICSGETSTLDAGIYAAYAWSTTETTQSIAVSSGTYTVTVTDDNLCTGTASVEVSSLPNPQPTITANALELCGENNGSTGGEAIFYFDAGAGFDTYLWEGGETTQTICRKLSGFGFAQDFTVTVTDTDGCTGTDDIEVTFNSLPTPFPTVTYDNCLQNSAIIDIGTVDFFGEPYETYQWSTGATTQSIATTTTGIYTVTVTTPQGCSNTATVETTQRSCNAESGTLIHNATAICEGGTLSANSLNFNNGVDFLQDFILFEVNTQSNTNTFKERNPNGTFSGLSIGTYLLCAYNEDTTCPPEPSMAAADLDNIGDTGSTFSGCFKETCEQIEIVECDPCSPYEELEGGSEFTVTSNGLILYELEICGGSGKFTIDLSSEGFVNMEEIPATTEGCHRYRFIYTPTASWTLHIIDLNDCNEGTTTYSSEDIDVETIIPIYITQITSTAASCPNHADGSIAVTVDGGDNSCGIYELEWGDIEGHITTVQADASELPFSSTLDDLKPGLYTVVITDCSGNTVSESRLVSSRRTRRRGRSNDCNPSSSAKNSLENPSLATFQVYPNPFAEQTTIEYSVLEDAHLSIEIFGVDGKQIATVFEGMAKSKQVHRASFEVNDLPTGVYILQLKTDNGEVYYERLYVLK